MVIAVLLLFIFLLAVKCIHLANILFLHWLMSFLGFCQQSLQLHHSFSKKFVLLNSLAKSSPHLSNFMRWRWRERSIRKCDGGICEFTLWWKVSLFAILMIACVFDVSNACISFALPFGVVHLISNLNCKHRPVAANSKLHTVIQIQSILSSFLLETRISSLRIWTTSISSIQKEYI